jgi:hypothetical protein
VRSVAAGDEFTLALRHDGTVAAWGRAEGGDLTPPATLGPVSEIAAGSAGFVIALLGAPTSQAFNPDLDGNRVVNGADLAALLAAWNATGAGMPADLDHDGTVNGADLSMLLAAWGPCE